MQKIAIIKLDNKQCCLQLLLKQHRCYWMTELSISLCQPLLYNIWSIFSFFQNVILCCECTKSWTSNYQILVFQAIHRWTGSLFFLGFALRFFTSRFILAERISSISLNCLNNLTNLLILWSEEMVAISCSFTFYLRYLARTPSLMPEPLSSRSPIKTCIKDNRTSWLNGRRVDLMYYLSIASQYRRMKQNGSIVPCRLDWGIHVLGTAINRLLWQQRAFLPESTN